jgi:hypothetical protein
MLRSLALAWIGVAGCGGGSSSDELVSCGNPDEQLRPPRFDELAGCTHFRGSIHISDSQLTDLEPLSELVAIDGTLSLFRNPKLVSLHGLERFESVGALTIRISDELTDITALASLRDLGAELWLDDNPVLEDLSGLDQLRSVGELRVLEMSRLGSLNGLFGITSVRGDLFIIGNAVLPQADAERFVAGVEVEGIVEISGNQR